jgi:hypothetical protein
VVGLHRVAQEHFPCDETRYLPVRYITRTLPTKKALMYSTFRSGYFGLLTLLLISPPLCAQGEWQLWREHKQVQVYSRPAADGAIEIRARTRVNTSLSAFIALLHDTEHLPEWIKSVGQVTVIDEPGRNLDLVHTRFKAPWPVANRDMVTSSEYRQPTPCSLVLEITDNHTALPKLDHHVRIVDVRTVWTLSTKTTGETEIDYRAHANVAGHLPVWLANRLSLQSALDTFVALRRELVRARYQLQTVEGIQSC